jgi:hypothetical protein
MSRLSATCRARGRRRMGLRRPATAPWPISRPRSSALSTGSPTSRRGPIGTSASTNMCSVSTSARCVAARTQRDWGTSGTRDGADRVLRQSGQRATGQPLSQCSTCPAATTCPAGQTSGSLNAVNASLLLSRRLHHPEHSCAALGYANMSEFQLLTVRVHPSSRLSVTGVSRVSLLSRGLPDDSLQSVRSEARRVLGDRCQLSHSHGQYHEELRKTRRNTT